MTREEVFSATSKIIHDCTPELEDLELKEESVVNTDMGIDSMGFILIICKIEGFFNIHIAEKEWQKLKTLGDVIDAIMVRINKK